MKFFKKRKPEAIIEEPEIADSVHLPEFIGASCLGEDCPNFKGVACTTTQSEWISAQGPIKGRDTNKTPLKDEADYIIYGQGCVEGDDRQLVAQEVYVFNPENISMMALVALTGRYGEMPVRIITSDSEVALEANTIS